MKPLFELDMPRPHRALRVALALPPPAQAKATSIDHRADRVVEHVAAVQDFVHRPLRQGGEHQCGQRELDDEGAERAHVGLREHAEARRQEAERDDEVDRAGDRERLEHRSFNHASSSVPCQAPTGSVTLVDLFPT
jgi:hypothetical protein